MAKKYVWFALCLGTLLLIVSLLSPTFPAGGKLLLIIAYFVLIPVGYGMHRLWYRYYWIGVHERALGTLEKQYSVMRIEHRIVCVLISIYGLILMAALWKFMRVSEVFFRTFTLQALSHTGVVLLPVLILFIGLWVLLRPKKIYTFLFLSSAIAFFILIFWGLLYEKGIWDTIFIHGFGWHEEAGSLSGMKTLTGYILGMLFLLCPALLSGVICMETPLRQSHVALKLLLSGLIMVLWVGGGLLFLLMEYGNSLN